MEPQPDRCSDIRRNLRGKAELIMTRNTLIEHAFGEIGGSITDLSSHLSGHSALIFTNENPFKLYSMLEKTKTKMAARPGETAPEDNAVSKDRPVSVQAPVSRASASSLPEGLHKD